MASHEKRHDSVAELLHFFVLRVPNSSRTRLIAFLYLSDVAARKYLGEPITDLQYVWYDRGPFDSRILNRLSALTESGVLREHRLAGSMDEFRYDSRRKLDPLRLSDRHAAILEHVAEEFGRMPVRSLFSHLRSTPPMANAKAKNGKGKPLDMTTLPDETELFAGLRKGVMELDRGEGIRFSKIRADRPAPRKKQHAV